MYLSYLNHAGYFRQTCHPSRVQSYSELTLTDIYCDFGLFRARTWAPWSFWDPAQDIQGLCDKATVAEIACCDHGWSPICAMLFHGSSQSRVSPVHSVCVPVAKHLECKFDLTCTGKQILHKDCISKRLEDSNFLWEAEKNYCLMLLCVASNRCSRFDIHLNCLLRAGVGILKTS